MEESVIKVRDRIFILLCLCIPFVWTPKILNMDFIGGPVGKELIFYPILLLFVYTFYITVTKGCIFASTTVF